MNALSQPLRVGIVGGNAERGWARDAHIPALTQLPQFTLAAVSARSQALADAAGAAFGATRAYGDSLAMVRATDLDLIIVTVKVPEHRDVVLAALESGKHVYCEWPLGCDLREAQEMAAAVPAGQHVMIGLQGLSAPAIRQAITLIRSETLGRPRVLRVFSPTAGWGAEAPKQYSYLQDKRNGATLETIAGGHTLAAVQAIVGRYTEVDARNSTLIDRVRILGSDEVVERTCADHMMILGKHASGCVSTLEVIGGVSGQPFMFELLGERGWLKIAGGHPGGYQVANLHLETSFPSEPLPDLVLRQFSRAPAAHLAEAYTRFADDIRSGTYTVPNFRDAVRLTRLLDQIELAAQSGLRQRLEQ